MNDTPEEIPGVDEDYSGLGMVEATKQLQRNLNLIDAHFAAKRARADRLYKLFLVVAIGLVVVPLLASLIYHLCK